MVEKVLGESAKVRALSQEVSIVCRRMDKMTAAEDLRRALVKDLHMEGVDMSISMRRYFNQSQAATIRLPVTSANKALQIGKVKVGWTRCALRLPVQLMRSFKCVGFDHQTNRTSVGDAEQRATKSGTAVFVVPDRKKRAYDRW